MFFSWESLVFERVGTMCRSSRPEVFCKKCVLRNFAKFTKKKTICARVFFSIKLQAKANNFIKKETLTQMFSCEFCKIFKNIFSDRTPPVVASERNWFYQSSFWRLCVPRMFTNLNMNDNKGKIGLGKEEILEGKKCLFAKILPWKNF